MIHSILSENLESCLESRLPSDVQAALDAHLAECSSCRKELEEAREAGSLLRLLRVAESDEPAPVPAPGFYLKVQESIAATPVTGSWWWMLHPAFRQIAMATLMIMAMLGGYYFTLHATELNAGTAAELFLDMPVEREAPAMLATGQHDTPTEMCLRCWHDKNAAASLNQHQRREQVMAAVAESGD